MYSMYVVVPRNCHLQSLTPTGMNGVKFTSKYGFVSLAVEQKEFMVEGMNEKGLSAGLFYFPNYGKYQEYDPSLNGESLADFQLVGYVLSQCATIDEVKEALSKVRVINIDPRSSTVHWRFTEPGGRQVVLEITDGTMHFYENPLGVLTNSPGIEWHLTNLSNYVNLYGGTANAHNMGEFTVNPIGSGSGLLGIPGDATPPSRFIRAAFIRNTAPQLEDAFATVAQTFHLLNFFDVPLGFEINAGTQFPDIPSATQWTSSIDLTHRKVYYHTAYNVNIRCIDLAQIDFGKVKYQWHPLDASQTQPVEMVQVK
jgi:choloylglycine hydrolase